MNTFLKFFSFLFILSIVFSEVSKAQNLRGCYKKKFIVSGYYSPQRNQSFYYRGDYSDETRLNGNGVRGASGKRVFNGMIAAPSKYDFGTNIYFPKYGWGQVQDRGQAIVQAGVRSNRYDRIDIWMGKGEQGLIRSLSFGKRVVQGYVCDKTNIKVGFNYGNFPVYNNFFKSTIRGVGLGKGRMDKRVETLQTFLFRLGYTKRKYITGYFGPITDRAVCEYQKNNGLLRGDSYLCGYFGPRTRQHLKDKLTQKGIISDKYNNYYIPNNKKLDKESNKKKSNTKEKIKKRNSITFKRAFKKGESSREVVNLQKYLKDLDYYQGKLNGKYNEKTIQAVYEFQLDHKIITKDSKIQVKGYFGYSTRKKMNKIIKKL